MVLTARLRSRPRLLPIPVSSPWAPRRGCLGGWSAEAWISRSSSAWGLGARRCGVVL